MTVSDSSASDNRLPLDRIRADVRAMHAYAVQDARGFLKLDAMENPYGLPPALQAELVRAWARWRSTATPATVAPTCSARWQRTQACPKASG